MARGVSFIGFALYKNSHMGYHSEIRKNIRVKPVYPMLAFSGRKILTIRGYFWAPRKRPKCDDKSTMGRSGTSVQGTCDTVAHMRLCAPADGEIPMWWYIETSSAKRHDDSLFVCVCRQICRCSFFSATSTLFRLSHTCMAIRAKRCTHFHCTYIDILIVRI